MLAARVAIVVAFLAVIAVPFAFHRASGVERADLTLVVVSPHVQQIRDEFSIAFDRWHRERFGQGVRIDWRVPGGTSDIRRQLDAIYAAACADGHIVHASTLTPDAAREFTIVGDFAIRSSFSTGYDLMLGGGTYDHGLRDPKTGSGTSGLVQGIQREFATADGPKRLFLPLSQPIGLDDARLREWFGDRSGIGVRPLWDANQHWVGTALSSFGIVYNRRVYAQIGLPPPASFTDLTDPRLDSWLALADARQSGSIETVFESILNHSGWNAWPEPASGDSVRAWLEAPKDGWRILRELSANTRYVTNSSTKPPIDVSVGEAAAGLCIDFYGRGQAQSVLAPGESARDGPVGYVDPAGEVFIDPDPVSMLLGAPHPDLARRFVEFCLDVRGQALWQFPALGDQPPPDALGPVRHELRRLPIRPVMFAPPLADRLIDRVDPYAIAGSPPDRGWRSAIKPMMACFGIESAHELRLAWRALNRARANPGFPPERLVAMERLFYEFPDQIRVEGAFRRLFPGSLDAPPGGGPLVPPDACLRFSPENYRAIRATWRDPGVLARFEVAYTTLFQENYARIVQLEREFGR